MALGHSPSIVTTGLVMCLDAANQRSYPGSGTVWTDVSGNGKNGTVTNSPTYSAANGGIFILDGVNDYIALPSQNDAQAPLTGFGSFTGAANNSFTLEMWIKTSQITGSASYNATGLIARDNGDIYANLTMYNGYVYWTHYDGAWQSGLKSTTMVANNTWHQIVYVNNSNTTGSIYVDSVNEVTAATTLLAGNYFSPDNIGWGYSGQYFLGSLGSVKFYDKSLTAAEVAQNFNALRGRYGI